MNQVDFSRPGVAAQPSPSIWGSCSGPRLIDDGAGAYLHEEFLGIGVAADKGPVGQLAIISTGTSVLTQKSGVTLQGGYLNVATGASDNDTAVLYTAPIASIVLNSGNEVWFECRAEVSALDDRAFFFGMVEQAGQTVSLLGTNPTAGQAVLVGESLLGFVSFQTSNAASKVDFVAKLDGGTAITILSDVTNAAAITSQGGTVGNLVAATPKKFGFRFDGKENIDIYVDGYKVYSYPIVAATFPKGVPMGAALGLLSDGTIAASNAYDWLRFGARTRR